MYFSEWCLIQKLPQKYHLANLNKENPLLLSSSQTQSAQSGNHSTLLSLVSMKPVPPTTKKSPTVISPHHPAERGVSVVFVHQPKNPAMSTGPCRQRGHPHIGRGKSIYCLALPLQVNCAISNTRKVLLNLWLSYSYRLFTHSHLFFL